MRSTNRAALPRETRGVRVTAAKCVRILCAVWVFERVQNVRITQNRIEAVCHVDATRCISHMRIAGWLQVDSQFYSVTPAGERWLFSRDDSLPPG